MYIVNKKSVNTIFIIVMLLEFMNISCKGHTGSRGSTGTAKSLYQFTSLTCVQPPLPSPGPTISFTVVSIDTKANATCQVLCTDISQGLGQKGSVALSTNFPLSPGGSFTLSPQSCDGTTCTIGNNIDCSAQCSSTDGAFGVSVINTVCS